MNKPLADRIRPKTLDDIVGQKHLIAPEKPLRKIIDSGDIPNLIFYGDRKSTRLNSSHSV